MKKHTNLLQITQAKRLPPAANGSPMWSFEARTISGEFLSFKTARLGPSERRWNLTSFVGQVFRISYHITAAQNHIAHTWRNSVDEGEDLEALFIREETLHNVEQERRALDAETRRNADRSSTRVSRI